MATTFFRYLEANNGIYRCCVFVLCSNLSSWLLIVNPHNHHLDLKKMSTEPDNYVLLKVPVRENWNTTNLVYALIQFAMSVRIFCMYAGNLEASNLASVFGVGLNGLDHCCC